MTIIITTIIITARPVAHADLARRSTQMPPPRRQTLNLPKPATLLGFGVEVSASATPTLKPSISEFQLHVFVFSRGLDQWCRGLQGLELSQRLPVPI